MFKSLLLLITLTFTASVSFAADKHLCHFSYEMITNADVQVNTGVEDQAADSPGGGAIFFYEIGHYERIGSKYQFKTIAQLDCADSSADKEVFKDKMLKNCDYLHMGGISVPMSEDFDFTKACG